MTADENRLVRNSETGVWRRCLLKWYFTFFLGFLSDRININFWLGGLVHFALSEWYLGHTTDPAHLFAEVSAQMIAQEESASLTIGGENIGFDQFAELDEARTLGIAMLEGYQDWAAQNDDFDVIASELAYWVPMLDAVGREFTFVARLDLLTQSSEGIRVIDFKTAKDFRAKETVDFDPQFRRYPMLVRLVHGWTDVVGSEWRGLRKIIPSARSKPPYFDRHLIDLTDKEYLATEKELLAEVTSIIDMEENLAGLSTDDHRAFIYPNPTYNCAWDCDYFRNGMCMSWRGGLDVRNYGDSFGTWDNDPYSEYKAEEGTNVPVLSNDFSRREGGE